MQDGRNRSRREFLFATAGATFATLGGGAFAQSFEFKPNQRYPDPAVQILDPGFAKYRIYSSTIEQVATGMRWAEGPVYFPEGGYLLVSDPEHCLLYTSDAADERSSVDLGGRRI